jgi:Flp pilus assembly protein TadB
MLRLTRGAGLLLAAYLALLLAVVIAGFLAAAVGLWAAVLWGVVLVAGLALYVRDSRRSAHGTE